VRRPVALVAAALAALALAAPAAATPETLKRSASNILFGPADILLSPATGAYAVYIGMRNQEDSLGVRIFYPLPGVIWNFGVQAGAGCVRTLSGLIELLPGIGLFFFDADLDPIFAPAERASAWVDYDTPPLYIKFGLNYTAPETL
jgi:hypothetical protein